MMKRKVLIICWTICCMESVVLSQFTNVELTQGIISGLKVFPESSQVPVYAFLGIPYAKAPVANLRFAPPEPHPGWNVTLLARQMQAVCLQLEQNPYEEGNANYLNSATARMSEDCLFLNIWAPETGFRSGNLPVVAVITGEEMAFDWMTHRPTGLDLAAEGIVVVTIQYRTNIFGWLALPESGNFGLLDQMLALKWIQENIHKFGGDNKKVTLLGHGTTGAASAMILLASPLADDLFSKMILMSGTIYSSYSLQLRNGSDFYLGPTRNVVLNLACDASETRFIVACLQRKSTTDLLKAYENVYQAGNYSKVLGPVRDGRVIVDDPRLLIARGEHRRIPIMTGICNQEGAFLKDNWIAFGRQGPKVLKQFIDTSIIPNILDHNLFSRHGLEQIKETIEWRYFDEIPKTVPYYMNALQTLISETVFEIPFFETIEIMSRTRDLPLNSSSSVTVSSGSSVQGRDGNQQNEDSFYVYSFQQPTPIDMRGRVNYFGGASHSSDLPFLMGPSLLQQIARRRLTQSEDKMCKLMKQLFGSFIKLGNPTPGRIFDAWKTYTPDQKFIKILSTRTDNVDLEGPFNEVEKNLVMLEYYLTPAEEGQTNNAPESNPYSGTGGSSSYLNEAQNYQYHQDLQRVFSFWRKFLVRIMKKAQLQAEAETNRNGRNDEMSEYDGSSGKFRHAFFSMLTLVCLLLAILVICVYLLKKNNRSFPKDDTRSGYL